MQPPKPEDHGDDSTKDRGGNVHFAISERPPRQMLRMRATPFRGCPDENLPGKPLKVIRIQVIID